jgi:hypothetical protein
MENLLTVKGYLIALIMARESLKLGMGSLKIQ